MTTTLLLLNRASGDVSSFQTLHRAGGIKTSFVGNPARIPLIAYHSLGSYLPLVSPIAKLRQGVAI